MITKFQLLTPKINARFRIGVDYKIIHNSVFKIDIIHDFFTVDKLIFYIKAN